MDNETRTREEFGAGILERAMAVALAKEPPSSVQRIPDTRAVQRAAPPYIPKAYQAASMTQWDVNRGGPENVGSRTQAGRIAKSWCEGAAENGRGMLAIVGPPGNGKSFLLYAAVRLLFDLRPDFKIFSRPWYRLADDLRYGGRAPWSDHKLESPELRGLLYSARAVAIDEVRPTAGTAFDDTELAKLACHAWDECLPMIITSNVSPLSDVLGGPAADRFVVITLTGPSLR